MRRFNDFFDADHEGDWTLYSDHEAEVERLVGIVKLAVACMVLMAIWILLLLAGGR